MIGYGVHRYYDECLHRIREWRGYYAGPRLAQGCIRVPGLLPALVALPFAVPMLPAAPLDTGYGDGLLLAPGIAGLPSGAELGWGTFVAPLAGGVIATRSVTDVAPGFVSASASANRVPRKGQPVSASLPMGEDVAASSPALPPDVPVHDYAPATPVPEPASIVVLAMAVLATVVLRRRRRW